MPVLFERVIYHIIADEPHFKWEIYNNNSWMPHVWHLSCRENHEQIAEMEPTTLYYPFDIKFPAVEFVLNLCFARRGWWHTSDLFGKSRKVNKRV